VGSVSITLRSTDDRTSSDELGYRFELIAGDPPKGMTIPTEVVRGFAGDYHFSWIDGRSRGQEEFAFTLRARAVDRGGNESAPIEIAIHDGGRLGCATLGGSPDAGSVLLFVMVVGVLWLRNRHC